MITQIAVGSVLVLGTTALHGWGTWAAIHVLNRTHLAHSLKRRTLVISLLVVALSLVSVVDAALWALTYVEVGALHDWESALYFSMVTFTTLGYGDIALGPEWRLLASFEAANGTIIFGWTTALVVAYLQRLMPAAGRAH